jgi:hypothetical protein
MRSLNEVRSEKANSLISKALIISISLCAFSMFLVKGIGKGDRIFDFIGIGLILFFLLLHLIYSEQTTSIKKHFSGIIFLLLAGSFFSAISAQIFHNQPILITLYQQRCLYYYFFYFLIPFIFPGSLWLKNFIFYMAIISAIIYVFQYFAYPIKLTEAKMFIDRGTLRINLPGSPFRHLGFFLCIDTFFRTFKRKYAFGALLLLIVAILSGYRSILALYILITIIYLIINNQIKNKLVIIIMAAIIGIAGYFSFHKIINKMSESAQRESAQGDDYVRVQAGIYFLNEMKKNPAIAILGNGAPSEQSLYGKQVIIVPSLKGYFLSDVGIIGSYFKFGILFVFAASILILRIIFMKIPGKLNFIRLYAIMQLSVLFTTFPSFEEPSGILAFTMLLSLIDYNLSNKQINKKKETQSVTFNSEIKNDYWS